jgi:hypothetical protein
VTQVLIVDPETQAVEWYRRGADGFERCEASAFLGISEADLHAAIDWPPT